MNRKHIYSLLLSLICPFILSAQTTVWQIGQKDGDYSEFALSDKSYRDFSANYPDAICTCSIDNNKTGNLPYLMPGPEDAWAGSPVTKAIIRFGMKGETGYNASIIADFVETHPYKAPVLEINLNGFVQKLRVPAGQNQDFFDNRRTDSKNLHIKVDIPAGVLKTGDNTLVISNVSGSWLVFDDIRLEAEKPIQLTKTTGSIDLISLSTEPAIIYGPDKEHLHPIKIVAANWGRKAQKAEWSYDGTNGGIITLEPGINTIQTGIPEGYAGKEVQISIKTGKTDFQKRSIKIMPAEKWTIYFVQHTHTDIGFTKPQTEILAEHLRYIDYAVEYCDATAGYPEASQFRWTCEASWAVREWLRIRPQEQIDKFLKYVKDGRIEVTAMFFNMSELSGENNYKTFLEPIAAFHEKGIEVVTAMQNDVNGVAWCLADYLPQIGVKYLTMGSNNHRADIPFDRPTVYWWESPSGSRVMSYRTDHYHTGNYWGVHTGQYESIQRNIFSYIESLKSRGYPFQMATVQYSGYHTDNSPPSMRHCDAIKKWNETYAWPKIKSATAKEFLIAIEEKHSDDLPVWKAAYPDWWTDGFGSAARESAASRKTQSDMITVSGMLSMAALDGDIYAAEMHDDIREIHEDLLFYDEHTFGAAESISNPGCENSQVQWAEKGSYVWEALKSTQMMYETAVGRLQGKLYRSSRPTLTFFNPLGWTRSSLSMVYIDFEVIPNDTPFNIVDAEGKSLKLQPLRSRSEGRYYLIWAEDIPAMGYKTYEIVLGEGTRHNVEDIEWDGNMIENDFYRLTFDKQNGGLTSLYDKELDDELHDSGSEWSFGGLIYESLNRDRGQMERKVFNNYRREGLKDVRYTGAKKGDIFSSIYFNGKLEGCHDHPGVSVEFRLYNNVKRIEMCYSLTRKPETDPSGIYVSFPVEVENGKLKFDVPGGLVEAGVTQIPRTSTPWNTVQNFVSAQNEDSQVVISTDAIPLFMMGELMNDPYRLVHKHEKTHMFSWIMNNYWTTNFRASQEGELKWNYVLTSLKGNDCSDATMFGWENRIPLYARVMPASRTANEAPREKSWLKVEESNMLVTSVTPSVREPKAVLVNVRETDGKASTLKFKDDNGRPMTVTLVNILDEPLSEPATEIKLKPFENVFVRVR